jgi:hypothetical protein
MGVETLLLAGMTAYKGYQVQKEARNESKAIASSSRIQMDNFAKETRARADRVRMSFLSSGFDLEGTPALSIGNILATGVNDLNLMTTNTNRQIKSIQSSARNKALGGFMQMAGGTGAMSGFMGAMGNASGFQYGMGGFGGIPFGGFK